MSDNMMVPVALVGILLVLMFVGQNYFRQQQRAKRRKRYGYSKRKFL